MGQGVVGPPQASGHVVGEDHVDGVVTSGQEKEDNSAQGGYERDPVEEDKSSWGILFDGKVAHGQCHGVSTEDVVTTVDVVSIDGETPAR